jgi:hypothetical protein
MSKKRHALGIRRIGTIRVIMVLVTVLFGFEQRGYAQSAGAYEVTFEEMGYQDVTLAEVATSAYYAFDLPANWEITQGNTLTLDFEYRIHLSEGVPYPPALLEVRLNGEPLHIEEMSTPTVRRVQISLPESAFRLSEEARTNVIEVSIDVIADCEQVLRSVLTIKNTSAMSLAYIERPLSLDLALFPRPIYQRYSFEPGHVRFVLPDEFDETDVRAAAIVAARLGQLTSHRLPISVTLASEQLTQASPGEHLIILGQPDENPVIRQLSLPIPLAQRQLALSSQMPTMVSPGSVLSYTLFVENTGADAQTVTVDDHFSTASAEFVDCGTGCEQVVPGKIRWGIGQLGAGQQVSKTIALRVKSPASSTSVQHTATLLDPQGTVLNTDTLSVPIGDRSDDQPVISPEQKSSTFFARGPESIAENAGVLQEMVSPWSARHAAVIVTGLSDEALLKAARGLNPRNHFPGIGGQTAIIEDLHPLSSTVSMPPRDVSLASLGYEDAELNVVDFEAIEYLFDFPPGATLGEGSHLALHFAHAEIVSTIGGGIKVTLNDVPIGSAVLNETNLNNAWLQIPLNRMAVRAGSNRIRVQCTVTILDPCIETRGNPYWVEAYADSFLRLDFRPAQTDFDLVRFPYPLNKPGDMANVLFALPESPSLEQIEGVLRIASLAGSASGSEEFWPQVVFGPDADMASLSAYHIVGIGLPTTNPLIHDANVHLPQPFVPDSNDIYQSIDGPIYGIPPGTALGLVQELTSPWDSEGKNAFVVATGTTDEGVSEALSALSRPSSALAGDLVIIKDDEAHSTDTRPLVATDVFSIPASLTATEGGEPGAATAETPTPEAVAEQPSQTLAEQQAPTQTGVGVTPAGEDEQPASPGSSRPFWLIPLLIVGVLTIVGAIILTMRKVL